MPKPTPKWDETADLVIMGSGAAAMSAAVRAADLGLHPLIFEATDKYGGSTAISGGVCWIANNMHMAGKVDDNPESGFEYLRHLVGDTISDASLRQYTANATRMLETLQANGAINMDSLESYPDYYPEAPGGRPGGRSMESIPFDATSLDKTTFAQLRRPHPQSQVMGWFGLTARQAQIILANNWRSKWALFTALIGCILRYFSRRKYGRDTRLTAGNALIGRLRKALVDRNVQIRLSSTVTGLIRENARVVGVTVENNGEITRIRARCGVLLAAGGFSRNTKMRQIHQQAPITAEWGAGNLRNQGDGHNMGAEVGGVLAQMDEAWWTPTILIPRQELAWVIVVEKNLPHCIIVDQSGHRFLNEAAPYLDVVKAMYAAHKQTDRAIPAWMIFDATFRHKYPAGPLAPGYAVPDKRLSKRYLDQFLVKANTVEQLAAKTQIDASTLQEGITRFNAQAVSGVDSDFNRGDSLSDRYYGDPNVKPNPCLGPIVTPPFYALQVWPGDLGTKGGLVTDSGARVLDAEGQPIGGLYAAGNCAASIMGKTYPGAGGTIAPALTFGFLSAESAHHDAQAEVTP